MTIQTADLCDANEDKVSVVSPMFRSFGGRNAFGGPITTLRLSNRIDGYFVGNARLTWKQDAEAPISVSLEVLNVFDKYYYTSLYEQFASPGTISGAPSLPRTWAVTLKKEF